jgi:hypothetical protein
MPISDAQRAVLCADAPEGREVDRLFPQALKRTEWKEAVSLVRQRLIKEHGRKLVSDGWAFRYGDSVLWQRRGTRDVLAPQNSCEIVFIHRSYIWLPDPLIYDLAHQQLGVARPLARFRNDSNEGIRQWVSRRFVDALALARYHYDAPIVPLALEKRLLAKAELSDEDVNCYIEALKKAPEPRHPLQSNEAERLYSSCSNVLKSLGDEKLIPDDCVILKTIKEAFEAGQAYTAMLIKQDHAMLKRNKQGSLLQGANPRLGSLTIEEQLQSFFDKHQRLPTTEEFIAWGGYEVENGRVLIHDSANLNDPDTWIEMERFKGRLGDAKKKLFPALVKRGRPRKA